MVLKKISRKESLEEIEPLEIEEEEPSKGKSKKVEITQIVKEVDVGYTLPDGETVDRDGAMGWLLQQVWEIKKAVA